LRGIYADLYMLNTELVGEYVKRSTNHQALLAALKAVNRMIQKASCLRMGAYKTAVVRYLMIRLIAYIY
jgi:Bardet-Biedl syndrome 2 protein